MASGSRKRGPPAALRIDNTNAHIDALAINVSVNPSSADVASEDSDISPTTDSSSSRPRSLRNMKNLSLTLPSSARSSSSSLHQLFVSEHPSSAAPAVSSTFNHRADRPRCPSIISLPATANSLIHRKEEDDDPSPCADGPVQIIPGIWLGSEDNARDWQGLVKHGIKAILNVAKEVASPFDTQPNHPIRTVVSTPDFKNLKHPDPTYRAPNLATGRPSMHYLKLQWSHGQQDLVDVGFREAMAFTDAALERGEGALVHCQCGISRSATLVIALVMRAAAERSPSVPPEVWALEGMQGAYNFVKEKSRKVGPNMSLIYQLMEYEKKLKQQAEGAGSLSVSASKTSSTMNEEEEEWGRRRKLLDEVSSDEDLEMALDVIREAEALDKAMEDRVVARKSSVTSIASTNSGTGVGMGVAWRSRYGHSRKRTSSSASIVTSGSGVISEDLVEEEEEEELLGVGGGFDDVEGNRDDSSASESSPGNDATNKSPHGGTARPSPVLSRTSGALRGAKPPPSAPVWKTSFNVPLPPTTAVKSTFTIPKHLPPSTPGNKTMRSTSSGSVNGPLLRPPMKPTKRRPAPIGILPPVPSSPIAIIVESNPPSATETEIDSDKTETVVTVTAPSPVSPKLPAPLSMSRSTSDSSTQLKQTPVRTPTLSLPPVRARTDSKKLPPPLHLRNSLLKAKPLFTSSISSSAAVSTPGSQTLFVFPPSPTASPTTAKVPRTPSTMTLTTTPFASSFGGARGGGAVPFPSLAATPRVSTFRGAGGRTRSFIGLGVPPAPTTAFSKVDVRGYVGLG